MKKFNFIYGALAAVVIFFTSCNPNDYPEFDDADAFVAFTSTTLSVDETGGSIEVPVLLTSLAGLEGTATIEVVDSLTTAEEGTHYTIEGSKTLNFTKDAPTQKLTVKVVDNAEFTGDVKLALNITTATGANLGKATTCTITIVDDEHPLKPILGTYSTYADTGRGEYTYDVTVEPDENDLTVVWFCNLEPYFAANGYTSARGTNMFYGIVNEDMTQIRIPAKQKLGYENVELVLIDPNTGAVLEGDIYVSIQDGGNTMVFETPWGPYDEGWWNYSFTTILTKK